MPFNILVKKFVVIVLRLSICKKTFVARLKRGSSERLSPNQKDTIDHVLKAYGNKTAQWLSDLTHLEAPWIEAREGLQPGERGKAEIELPIMYEYYSSINERHQLKS